MIDLARAFEIVPAEVEARSSLGAALSDDDADLDERRNAIDAWATSEGIAADEFHGLILVLGRWVSRKMSEGVPFAAAVEAGIRLGFMTAWIARRDESVFGDLEES